jgi:hypothetical protein
MVQTKYNRQNIKRTKRPQKKKRPKKSVAASYWGIELAGLAALMS